MAPKNEFPSTSVFHEIPVTREEIKKTLESRSIPSLFWILSGKAGTGKTYVMEALASKDVYPLHSSRLIDKNICTQILFEALLAKELAQNPLRFVVEDKGRKIAHLSVPEKLLRAWDKSPHFVVEAPFEERIDNIYQSHVANSQVNDSQLDYLKQNRDRMGEALFQKLYPICQAAYRDGDTEMHKEWLRLLVVEHLDPIYEYYFHHKASKVQFSGHKEKVIAYLNREVEKLQAMTASLAADDKSESLVEKSKEPLP